ncbi:MAG: tRNA (adenosine(37)-N6)-threonylcarbamoyltransferase complex ATPase subunit type 1 TsaE [Hyphomicrobiaceae bacterium]
MTAPLRLENCSETDVTRFAQVLAFSVQPGDIVCLSGDLGAGKTTLARAAIQALLDDDNCEIPSPTYTLVQTYDAARFSIAHFDLYRLGAPEELDELGLDYALTSGIALLEWPEQAQDLIPPAAFHIYLSEQANNHEQRSITLTGQDRSRVSRLMALHKLLQENAWPPTAQLRYLQGDASVRRYARLAQPSDSEPRTSAIVMDWAEQPDGPPVRDGLPYSQIAHLAENIKPFLGVTSALREIGLSAPKIFSADIENGFVVLEDFGGDVFQTAILAGEDPRHRYRAAVEVLVTLRQNPPPETLAIPGGQTPYQLPNYDLGAFGIETELLTDWYFPAILNNAITDCERETFTTAWRGHLETLSDQPSGWVLRDFHSPNLISLPNRKGVKAVGLIDVQDALRGPLAYDLVSLLQDARVDIAQDVESELLDAYCAAACSSDRTFDEALFRLSYAIAGAQRNTKILGIFARLAVRDGKPGYLRHLPRIWGYLARNLAHPELADLKAWYDGHFPVERRSASLNI